MTLAQYEILMNALELRQVDEDYKAHRQAFLNFAVQAERSAGKGKTKPVYKCFRQFFDYKKEIEKVKKRKESQKRIHDYVLRHKEVKNGRKL